MNNGGPQNRVDVAILGDGYTAAEMEKYKIDVQQFIQGVFAEEPYREYQRYYNVHRVDVISSQSGADHPERNPPSFVSTAFDATYNCSGIQRLICINTSKVSTVLGNSLALSQFDVALVLVNDSEYGGSGGSIAVASTNPAAVELILHEVGHGFALLADEYIGGGPSCNPNFEPFEVNATREINRLLIKWNYWIDSATPIPTISVAPGVPGLYHGAKYCDAGLYRPTSDSKMRNLGKPFEQINTEQHVKRIYNFVSPLDASEPGGNSVTITQGQVQTFGVTTPVPLTHTLDVTWFVDGQSRSNGNMFNLDSITLAPGSHTIEALVNDGTPMVRNDPEQLLSERRSWSVQVNPANPSLTITGVEPLALQTREWGESVSYTITVRDNTGNPVSGATIVGIDNLRGTTFTTSPSTTDNNGQITYTAIVPNGAANLVYGITFIAQKLGYTESASVTRQVQVNISTPTLGLQYYPLPNPVRLLDTRPGEPACVNPAAPLTGGAIRTEHARLACTGIPANAQAIVGNATVVNTAPNSGGGHVILYPSGVERPSVSNLNYLPGQVVPNAFTVRLGGDGAFQVYAASTTHFIVDITGYYAPPNVGGLYYHPLPQPVRLLDTRPGQPACHNPGDPLIGSIHYNESAHLTCNGVTIPTSARAVVGNATVVNTLPDAQAGHVTLFPAGAAPPTVSNLNYVPGQVVPNAFTVGVDSNGLFRYWSSQQIHFIIDITGYYSDQATDINGAGLRYYPLPSPMRLLDTRAGEPACDQPGVALTGNTIRAANLRLPCSGVAASAQAVVGNATVVNTTPDNGYGFVTLFPHGATLPGVSNLNYVPGQVVPNAFTVGLSGDGRFSIYSYTTTHLIVDVAGYYAP